MTSRKIWPILAALLLILALFLVACERPLPSDGSGDAPEPAPPVDTESGTYPAPEAGESDPTAPETGDAEEGYPAPDDESVPLPEEDASKTEGYPAEEGDLVTDDAREGETAEGDAAEGETTEGEATESEATEVETAEGETTEGEAAEGETAEGETTEGEAAEGETAEGETAESESTATTHTVGAGDTLFSIGLQYGMSWVAIAEANDITNPDSLYIGQELIIPDLSVEDTTEDEAESVGTDSESEEDVTVVSEGSEAEEPSEIIHVVQSGENLYRISLKYGVDMMDVARANELANFDSLAVGQELIIPGAVAGEEDAAESGAEEETSEPAAEEEITHVVQEGETVFGIAFKYGISWTKLVERNDISSPYTLETGQVLVVPSGG